MLLLLGLKQRGLLPDVIITATMSAPSATTTCPSDNHPAADRQPAEPAGQSLTMLVRRAHVATLRASPGIGKSPGFGKPDREHEPEALQDAQQA